MAEVILGIAFYLMVSIGVAMEAYLVRPEEFKGFRAYFSAFIIGLIWPVILGCAIGKAGR